MNNSVNFSRFKKTENIYLKSQNVQNPIAQSINECPQNEVISNDGSQALKNNFIGQCRVNFRGLKNN